ncbi:unnamed protein product [Linum tenue]|nr:unnamed protein product [Linum tenue]
MFGLRGLEYLNLSYNSLDGEIPNLEKMWSLRALDLSHNALSGEIPQNISNLQDLAVLNLSFNSFSGSVPKNESYKRFPGAFAGNPHLCLEGEGCDDDAKQLAIPGRPFHETDDEGPILAWVFCLSAVVSCYSSLMVLFCSSKTRRYIFHTKGSCCVCK